MNYLRFAFAAWTLLLALGCGSSGPGASGEMTPELQAKIEAEELAVEEDERAAAASYKPAKKR